MKKPVSLETALVRSNVTVSPEQRKRLVLTEATTRYSGKRIVKFLKAHGLTVEDTLECLEISEYYGMPLHKMDELLKVGFSPSQLSSVAELRDEVEPESFDFVYRGEEGEGFLSPNLSEYVAYRNIIFLDELSGWNHDADEIRGRITEIRERTLEAYRVVGRKGIGVVLHRMRERYEDGKRSGETLGFDELLNRSLCHIPKESLSGRS